MVQVLQKILIFTIVVISVITLVYLLVLQPDIGLATFRDMKKWLGANDETFHYPRNQNDTLVPTQTVGNTVIMPHIYTDNIMMTLRSDNGKDVGGLHAVQHISQYGILEKHNLPEKVLINKYIVYRCKSMCGGLADREKGIVTSYIISQILRRKFGLIMKTECDFSKYVLPNEVDWLVNNDMLKAKSTGYIHSIDTFDLGIRMRDDNLEKLFDKDVMYYQGNMDFVPFLMNKSSFQSISWARNKSSFDIYRIAFSQLFRLAPDTQRKYEHFQTKVKNDHLICAHLRMGRTKTLPHDADFTYNKPDPFALIQFLKQKITHLRRLFIATDSDDVRTLFKEVFPEYFIEIEGKIVHIDRSGPDYDCSGMEKAILDQLILSTCDTLVMSSSGFSRVAAIIRGTDDNLYIAHQKNVTKSKRLNPT